MNDGNKTDGEMGFISHFLLGVWHGLWNQECQASENARVGAEASFEKLARNWNNLLSSY